MKDSVFRMYDIRGVVGSELAIDQVYDATRAIALYFVQQQPNVKTVAVGMDGRNHSLAIKEQVCKALADSGLNVVFIGTCPSPVLYYATCTIPVQAGLMITASHNPGNYNGLKICLGTESVWGEQIQEIKKLFHAKKHIKSKAQGAYTEQFMVPPYIDWLVEHFPHLVGCSLSAMIDCGNGAAGTVLPELIKKMRWNNVLLLFPEVDGDYPNHEADPVVEKNMQALKEVLATTDVDFGLGLDGDCDRMAPMTKVGCLVPGDKLLAVFAQSMIKEHPDLAVVFDIKSSSGLIELLEKWGAKPCISPSGHSIIKREMKKHNALLAGELSCHFIFKDRYFGYDDGIYAIMRLFEIMIQTGKTMQELISIFPHKFSSSELRLPCDEDKKSVVVAGVKNTFSMRNDVKIITIDGVRATMDYGWGIVRASNTQSVLSLRFESDSQDGLRRVKEDFFAAMKPYFDDATLRQQMSL